MLAAPSNCIARQFTAMTGSLDGHDEVLPQVGKSGTVSLS